MGTNEKLSSMNDYSKYVKEFAPKAYMIHVKTPNKFVVCHGECTGKRLGESSSEQEAWRNAAIRIKEGTMS